ncbi:hypothetical protein BaRGS_00007914, partial [Batillaria attramentaria]
GMSTEEQGLIYQSKQRLCFEEFYPYLSSLRKLAETSIVGILDQHFLFNVLPEYLTLTDSGDERVLIYKGRDLVEARC